MNEMFVERSLNTAVVLGAACLLAGCGTTGITDYNAAYEAGQYQKAIQVCEKSIDPKEIEKAPQECLLWDLQAAAANRYVQNYDLSNMHLDRADASFNYFDQKGLVDSSARGVKGMVVNDSALPFRGTTSDRIMGNVYKALNFAATGDMENARIELNRVAVRQQDAKDRFARQIAKEEEKLKAAEEGDAGMMATVSGVLNTVAADGSFDSMVSEKYSTLDEFKAYPDYVNPFATYISGLLFYLEGDLQKCTDILKESYAMDEGNAVLKRDFSDADNGIRPRNQVWVIFENGLAVEREELAFDFPIPLPDGPMIASMALPTLKERGVAYPVLNVKGDDQVAETISVCDFDRVVKTEFKKERPHIIKRELIRQTIRVAGQYAAQQAGGGLTGLGAGLAQAAMKGADLRTWSALPKEFQVARLDIPKDRKLTLSAAGGASVDVEVPACNNAIVYVRIPKAGVTPAVEVISFK